MYDTIDKQTVLIECLTLYMNYFKVYFSLVYQQLEYYVNLAKSITNSNCQMNNNNSNNRSLSSISLLLFTNNKNTNNKTTHPQFTYSPFNLPLTQHYSKSYIDRFHMRIIQYLEYRLVNVINKSFNKNQDQIFILVKGFISSLNQVFMLKVNYKNKNKISQSQLHHKFHNTTIGSLFLQIEHCIESFFQGIFKYLENIYLKDLVILQQLKSFKNKIFKQIFSPFHQYLITFLNYSTQTSQFNDTQNLQYHQNNNLILNDKNTYQQKKSSFKIQQSYRSLLSSKGSQFLRKNITEIRIKNNINSQKKIGQQFEFQKRQQYHQKQIMKQKKNSYADLLSIMQIQAIDIFSREYIMRELKAKNMKNKLLIGKFVKLYKKKQKRHKQNKEIFIQNKIQKHQQCHSLTESIQCVGDGSNNLQFLLTHDDNNNNKSDSYSLKQKIVAIRSLNGSNTYKNQQKKADSQLQKQKIIVSNKNVDKINTNNNSINIDRNNNRNDNIDSKNNSHHSIQQKLTPNKIHQNNNQNSKKHDTLRHFPHVAINNPLTTNQSQLLQLTKDAFLYKQKEKLYFQQLKSKMSNIKMNPNINRFQKVSLSSIPSSSSLSKQMIKKDGIKLQMFNRVNINKITTQRKFIQQQHKYIQETKLKQSQRNLIKKLTTIKGPNFSSFIVVNNNNNNSNKTNDKQQIKLNYYSQRSCHSNSQLLSKNHLLLQNNNNSQQTPYILSGSSVQKLLHTNKKRRQISLLQQKQQNYHDQQEQSSQSLIVKNVSKNNNNFQTYQKLQRIIKSHDRRIKKNNYGEIQNAAVVVLPRIKVIGKLKTTTTKNNNNVL